VMGGSIMTHPGAARAPFAMAAGGVA